MPRQQWSRSGFVVTLLVVLQLTAGAQAISASAVERQNGKPGPSAPVGLDLDAASSEAPDIAAAMMTRAAKGQSTGVQRRVRAAVADVTSLRQLAWARSRGIFGKFADLRALLAQRGAKTRFAGKNLDRVQETYRQLPEPGSDWTRYVAAGLRVAPDQAPPPPAALPLTLRDQLDLLLRTQRGTGLSADEGERVVLYEAADPSLATGVARLVYAYRTYQAAAVAHEGTEMVLDASALATARMAMVMEADSLAQQLRDSGSSPLAIQIPPYVSLSLTTTDDVYYDDFALLVDAGGADRYRNNAGGNNVRGLNPANVTCATSSTSLVPQVNRAAALFDLDGDDAYQTTGERSGSCGVNGGGYYGAGTLFDAAGSDVYTAGFSADRLTVFPTKGTNGGGYAGSGLLVDPDGDDTYETQDDGANGGVRVPQLPSVSLTAGHASGTLVDGGGRDRYIAGSRGVNGGASGAGNAALFDLQGVDQYRGGSDGVNGGAASEPITGRAAGVLVDDGAEADIYTAGARGVNGGAAEGEGLLVDRAGNDVYQGQHTGVNGAGGSNSLGACLGCPGGSGALLDLAGYDVYEGGAGSNGTGYGTASSGLLVDLEGSDHYTGSSAANGAGGYGGVGSLVDADGNDTYLSTQGPANGGAKGLGAGYLLDYDGSNRFEGGSNGVNGGGTRGGSGHLISLGGLTDTYQAKDNGVNGGGYLGKYETSLATASGLLFDTGGVDLYSAGQHGTNGGAQSSATGAILDGGGSDSYVTTSEDYICDSAGQCTRRVVATNGGADEQAVGLIADAGGNDTYDARGWGPANGGGTWGAVGAIVDTAGDDEYQGGTWASNGGSAIGVGLLIDTAGDDTYVAGRCGVNGGGFTNGCFSYTCVSVAVVGDVCAPRTCAGAAAARACVMEDGSSMLLDTVGTDYYSDRDLPVYGLEPGTDLTIVPKGRCGAQLDLPSPAAADPDPAGCSPLFLFASD